MVACLPLLRREVAPENLEKLEPTHLGGLVSASLEPCLAFLFDFCRCAAFLFLCVPCMPA